LFPTPEHRFLNVVLRGLHAKLVGCFSDPTQESMKAYNPMDSNAKMKKKHAKKSMKSDDSVKSGTSTEGTKDTKQ
jgi:hypothetical protein